MNLTDPSVIKHIRTKFGFDFKKAFGQNFLTSQKVLDEICKAASGADGILEIGPGFGTLTNALAENFGQVVAIELDSRLPEVLEYTLSDHNNVEIIQGDCLKIDIGQLIGEKFGDKTVSVAANLPYYITTPVITTLLESKLPLDKIVVMVQKEVAERICANPGGKDYGAISVLCSYYSKPEMVCKVPAGCFVPAPKVDSAVVCMDLLKEPSVSVSDEKKFFAVVKAAFAQRRKTLSNCLSSGFHIDKQIVSAKLSELGIEPNRRGETLSLEEYAKITDSMIKEGW